MMKGARANVVEAIGGTPIVKLSRVAAHVKSEIYVKLEYLNPGGSMKDRVALNIIRDAERRGLLSPGSTIIEATSGNTGAGLALVGAIRGYKCIFVMPDKMSAEKIALLRAYGAEVIITPTAVPPDSPESYYRVADRLTEEIPGAFQPNQYFNQENPAAHYETTGPEIWRQTDGRIDVFVAGVGTGGTITGAARYLKERNPDILIVGADPEGSIYSGDVHPYLTEGIGEDFWPATLDPALVDRWVRVSDGDAFRMARRVTREEGILVGGSCGTAVVAALEVAEDLDETATIVVILPDTGRNYLSKVYSDPWLLQYGLLDRPEVLRVEQVLGARHGDVPPFVTVNARDKVRQAIDVLQEYGISQAPVVREPSDDVTQVVGSIRERALLDRIFRDPDALQAEVAQVMGPPIPMVEARDPVEVAIAELHRAPAILVSASGRALGVLTRSDFLEFLAHRPRTP